MYAVNFAFTFSRVTEQNQKTSHTLQSSGSQPFAITDHLQILSLGRRELDH